MKFMNKGAGNTYVTKKPGSLQENTGKVSRKGSRT
jgi:hypothetical protein